MIDKLLGDTQIQTATHYGHRANALFKAAAVKAPDTIDRAICKWQKAEA
ncbi:hypothetical protein [Ruegeria sp.]